MRIKKTSWGSMLDRYPLAPEHIQNLFHPNWTEENADDYHSIRVIAPDVYAKVDEDLGYATRTSFSGALVFSDPEKENWLKHAIEIEYSPGWTLRLRLAIRMLQNPRQ